MKQVMSYEDQENSWMRMNQLQKDNMKLEQGFQMADVYLNHSYLEKFSVAPLKPETREIMNVDKIHFIELTKLVMDKKEKFTDKLISVYSAIHNLNAPVTIVLNSDGKKISFYIGVRSINEDTLVGEVLEATLKGNFPGIEYRKLDKEDTQTVISNVSNSDVKSLSSVSIVPAVRDKNKEIDTYVQGLEKFIDTMTGMTYTMVALATPLDFQIIEKRKHGYEELCSALSPYSKLTGTYGKNESDAVSRGMSSTFSQSINHSISNSNSTSTSRSSGTNEGRSQGDNFGMSSNSQSGGMNWGMNSGTSSGSFSSYTSGSSFAKTFSESTGSNTAEGITDSQTSTKGSSSTVTVNYENKGVLNLIERAQEQLKRFQQAESFGMWEFCCYFMSRDIQTSVLAGNAYRALMLGDSSRIESAHLNVWSLNQKESINTIIKYIMHLKHPVAEIPPVAAGYKTQLVTPTNMISGNEIPYVMGFPKKSVNGLAVVEMAEFGRAVVYENKIPERQIDFGNIYHMGISEHSRVNMDLDLLASHCFITGSSGSGKSYATYQLLECALKHNVKIMIIEPAKGEYKQIFGGLKGIKIFTTDPNTYKMLKINPFQFPDNIHVLSHIEQLLQIFNASWPLYAAMPAILKQAVVDSYINCGWDVQNSIWIAGICDHKYPVFEDVLNILPGIINHSEYSSDSKGDYKGALLTRVQSMTTGISGLVFKNSEGIADAVLFESNTVVDLSELGSEETIALIMGVLIMKLGEYRKSQRKKEGSQSLNSKVRHITVLEEAHNLLKRTSKDQNQEGANMIGKSVEMISNSIKEMRTYGEGFLIIDQSPMAVDTSAIENTATKIILNTPAQDACKELGSALSLNPEQTKELSKLNVGVAAVFQKGWLTPVLMKVDEWKNCYEKNVEVVNLTILRLVKGELVEMLYKQREAKKFSPISLRMITKEADLPVDKRREIDEIILQYSDEFPINKEFDRYTYGNLLMELLGCEQLFKVIPMEDIPTYSEVDEYENPSEELSDLLEKSRQGARSWFEKMFEALSQYAVLNDEWIKKQVIFDLVYVLNKSKDYPDYLDNPFITLYELLEWEYGTQYEEE